MLDLTRSRQFQSVERAVANANLITAEGALLVADYTISNGVKLAVGDSTDVFAGVAFSQQLTPDFLPWIDEEVVDYAVVTLTFTPAANSIRVVANGTTLTAGNPSNANEYSISGKVITVNSAREGQTVVATYRYEPTTLQVKSIQGDIPPGGAAGLLLNQVGVIIQGDIWTTEFDTAADWSGAAPVLRHGASGRFTTTSAGGNVVVPNCRIIERPSVNSMFLGVSIRNG